MKGLSRTVLLCIGVIAVLMSCDTTSEESTTENTEIQDPRTRYGSQLNPLPKLSESAQEATSTWSVFEDFTDDITALKNQTAPAMVTTTEKLNRLSDSLLSNIPEVLNTQPIYARLKIADTRVKLLEQQVNYDRIDSLQLENSLTEMYSAASNLFIEINRIFIKSKIDEALKEGEMKELENQKRFLDSVYQSEIEDNDQN